MLGGSRVAFAPDGRLLAVASWKQAAQIWDLETGLQVRRIEWAADDSKYTSVDVVWSPDGKYLLTGGAGGIVRVWDAGTWQESRRFGVAGPSIVSLAFSPNGKLVLSASRAGDNSAHIWDYATGKERLQLVGHTKGITCAAFSPDGRFVATGSKDGTTRVWDSSTGKQIGQLAKPGSSVVWLTDGRHVVVATEHSKDSGPVVVWDVTTGQEQDRLPKGDTRVGALALSPDGRSLVAVQASTMFDDMFHTLVDYLTSGEAGMSNAEGDGQLAGMMQGLMTFGVGLVELWDVSAWNPVRSFTGAATPIGTTALSPDGKSLVIGYYAPFSRANEPRAARWELTAGLEAQRFSPGAAPILVRSSPDGRFLLSQTVDLAGALTAIPPSPDNLRLLDPKTGDEIAHPKGDKLPVAFADISFDSRFIAIGAASTIRILDAVTSEEVRRFEVDFGVAHVAFTPDGRSIVVGGATLDTNAKGNMLQRLQTSIRVLDVTTGAETRRLFDARGTMFSLMRVSPNGRFLVCSLTENLTVPYIQIFDLATGKAAYPPLPSKGGALFVTFSSRNRTAYVGFGDGTVIVLDLDTGKEVRRVQLDVFLLNAMLLTPDERFLVTGSSDGTTRFWDSETGRERARLVSFTDGTWAVVDPDGRFDASNGGDVQGLHFVVGLESISLSQLKDRYYEPGLLAKILGFNREPLRDVRAFREVKLFPKVDLFPPASGGTRATITLTNRGGGIGPVRVFVNDKELTPDARGPRTDPNALKTTLTVDLLAAHLRPGVPNTVRVVAYNAEGYLASRGTEISFTPRGTAEAAPPEIYAIVVGTSTYAAPERALDLKFAAKDAVDVANALEVGADRLFGASQVHLTLLTTAADARAQAPTKANIAKAFEAARRARPQDVLVVYLAGHGVTLEGSADTYCYLTADARGTRFADAELRKSWAVTSEELTEWVKAIPALKQVLVLDTCAAGAAAAKLVETRAVSGDQVRAIDRLKDRTGFHVLMGSASDAASYEASQYGQGLLTYALLQGMKGAALREEEFVDVSRLFNYAADQVPQLARNVGGIQRPVIAAPRGTSFDIGQLKVEDRAAIPLASVKPLLLRPRLVDVDVGDDTLGLIRGMRARLREASYIVTRGEMPVVYVDEEELPGAVRPAGTYRVEGDTVKVRLVLRRDDKTVADVQVEGAKSSLEALLDKLAEVVLREASTPR